MAIHTHIMWHNVTPLKRKIEVEKNTKCDTNIDGNPTHMLVEYRLRKAELER